MGYQKKSVYIPELLVNSELCTGSLKISNVANENFAKFREYLGSNFPDSYSFLTYLDTSAERSFTFDQISLEYLETLVHSLKTHPLVTMNFQL